MSDFHSSRARRYRNAKYPGYGTGYQPAAVRADNWGWIAAALCMAVILIIALSVGHEPNRIAANVLPPAATHAAPPPAALDPSAPRAPGLVPPPAAVPAPALAPHRP
jgi:hypothetical protein